MNESPCFGTFIFCSANGRFSIPPGAEIVTRRVPPKPANLERRIPAACGTVVPEDAKDADLRQVLVLNTNLFCSLEDLQSFLQSDIGRALWDSCDNAVLYRVDAPGLGGRAKSTGGVPPKPAAQKRKPPKPAKKTLKRAKKTVKTAGGKAAAKTARKAAKKVAKKITKNKGMKKSKKPMQTLSRGGVPPKPTD